MPVTIFNSQDTFYKTPFGAVRAGETVAFTLTVPVEFGCTTPYLLFNRDGEQPSLFPLQKQYFRNGMDVFSTTIQPQEPGLYFYYFDLYTGYRKLYAGQLGEAYVTTGDGEAWQLTVYEPSPAPDWFGRGVTYQIFPDRFRRVSIPDVSHMPGHRWLHRSWNEQPVFLPDEHGQITNRDFFGGSLQGITEKLDYLAGLGVTTLYLNPIFEAASNHRYDTGDYRAIDPLLGTEADFRALCTAAHQRGMRVILDGVFNHTGSNSRYFNAEGYYPEPGAAQSQNSEYYNWYSFHPWPSEYDAWWGVRTLPAVNEEQPDYRDFIFGGVSNSTSVAGMVRLRKDLVSLGDGLFETLLIRRPKQFGDLSRIITGVLNQYYDNENVILVQSKNLRFTFQEPVAWTRDGEAGGVTTDVTLRNNHAAIHIIA